MAMGRGRAGLKDGVFVPSSCGFVLPHLFPTPHDRENFFTPSLPLRAPPHPIKLYFLLICLTTSTIVFNETYFINKNILEITTKFIPSNQINFQKKLNNISKRFNKTITKKKKKTHSIVCLNKGREPHWVVLGHMCFTC